MGFLAEKPFADDILNTLKAPRIYVVPNMAANGFLTREKLPRVLRLTGPISDRMTPHGRQQVILTEPAGTHPLIPRLMAENVQAALKNLTLSQEDTALVVIGHGSSKSHANAEQTEKVAAALPGSGLDLPIVTAFLAEEPNILNWRQQPAVRAAKTVLFAPFLIADGFHATLDIPLAIGFDPGDAAFKSARSQGCPAHIDKDKQTLIYLAPVGESPKMVDIFLARIEQARLELDT